MPFDIDEFTHLRPFAYHVTDRANLASLRSHRRLCSAESLIRAANRLELLGLRRIDAVVLHTPEGLAVLKDQRPLIALNMELVGGWSLDEFVHYLNGFTYFWPGQDRGPIGPGQRLLAHYEAEGPAVLRIPMQDLLRDNVGLTPEFCPFNSGAPRYHSGKRAIRGSHLFTPAAVFPRRASEVVELGFRGDVTLPTTTLVRSASGWERLA